MGLIDTIKWFSLAKPNPTKHDLQVQVGVHIEEFEEFLKELSVVEGDFHGQHLLAQAMLILDALGDHFKNTEKVVLEVEATEHVLDAICDGMVTGTGVAHMLGMDLIGGFDEVNKSNFSKFDENGQPIFKSNGKIGKNLSTYREPNLTPFLALAQPRLEDVDSAGVADAVVSSDASDDDGSDGAVAAGSEEADEAATAVAEAAVEETAEATEELGADV